MKKSRLLAAVFVLVSMHQYKCISANSILDQSNIVAISDSNFAILSFQVLAQTFTVGVDGLLTGIDVQVFNKGSATDDLILDLVSTELGVPNGESLYTATIPVDTLPIQSTNPLPFTSIDISSAGIFVSTGDVLSIVLQSNNSCNDFTCADSWLLWGSNTGNPYADGRFFINSTNDPLIPAGLTGFTDDTVGSTFDLGFNTYVDPAVVPLPAALALRHRPAGVDRGGPEESS